jgi:CxxC motif-containing protein (DUF1111 family)
MRTTWHAIALALVFAACREDVGGVAGTATGSAPFQGQAGSALAAAELGGPIPGLTPSELAAFQRGKAVFQRRFRPSEGLGPFYNATSCASCHSTPVTGGSARLYRNFFLAVWGTSTSQFTLPPFLSPVIPAFGSGPSHPSAQFTLEGGRTPLPTSYAGFPVTSAQRNGIPIFGVGLFEAVSDATILSRADPEDADGDGISGRFNTDFGGSIGRFGVKAQSNNIELFTRAPLQNQMGITTDPFLGSGGVVSASYAAPFQVSASPNDPTIDNDGVPDPELPRDELGDLIAFSRFLAPPAKKPFNAAAQRGEVLFDQLGCARCHVPSLPSSRGPVEAYTDLLLHDMGPRLSDGLSFGSPQFSASSPTHTREEFRTQPLWGVSLSAPFIHDGRAGTLNEAILLHGGEAQKIREDYARLAQSDQDDIIAFLEHL